MPLDELPQDQRNYCSNCLRWGSCVADHRLPDGSCGWSESAQSVRERAKKKIAELEALVPHPGDGSCDKCGAVPATHVPMVLCPECYGTEKRIAELEAALQFYAGRLREDGNGYEFDDEPSSITGGVARAALKNGGK